MLFKSFVSVAILASSVSAKASPVADALPWANALPQAQAAADAYAEAYAEAIAIGHPDAEAYALAASADDCASIGCHAACGYLILDGAACSENKTDTYSGPYNDTCLCTDNSKFMQRYPSCMECGWTLWKYYGPYVTEALAACSTLSTEPTGTLRCSTTLSESYTKDANAGCEYGGTCVTSSAAANSNSTVETTGSSNGTAAAVTSSARSSSGSGSSSGAASSSGSDSDSSSASSTASSSASSSSNSTGSSSANGAQMLVAGSSVFAAALLALMV